MRYLLLMLLFLSGCGYRYSVEKEGEVWVCKEIGFTITVNVGVFTYKEDASRFCLDYSRHKCISREVFEAAKQGKKIQCLGLGKPREAYCTNNFDFIRRVDDQSIVAHHVLFGYDWVVIEPKIEISESRFDAAWDKAKIDAAKNQDELGVYNFFEQLKKELGFK